MSFDQFDLVVSRASLPAEPAKGSAVLEGMPGVVLYIRPQCTFQHYPCYRVFFADGTDRMHLSDRDLAFAEPQQEPEEPEPEDDDRVTTVGCLSFFAGLAVGVLGTLITVWLS